MPDKLIHLPFPKNGLFRGLAHEDQPLSTTPDCLNVRPHDPVEGRLRGGTRPGIVPAFYRRFEASPIRLINHVDVDSTQRTFVDPFNTAAMQTWWKKPNFADYPLYLGPPYPEETGHTNGFLILDMDDASIHLDASKDYVVSLAVTPHTGAYGVAFHIMLCCEDGVAADPNTKGILVYVGIGTKSVQGEVKANDGTTTTSRPMTSIGYKITNATTIVAYVKGGNQYLDVRVNDELVIEDFPIPTALQSLKQIGIGATSFVSGRAALIDLFRLAYEPLTSTYTNRRELCVSAGTRFYVENYKGDFDLVPTDYLLRDDVVLESVPYGSWLFIADWDAPMFPADTKCDPHPDGATPDGIIQLDPSSSKTFADIMDNTTCKQFLISLTKEPGINAHEGTYKIKSIDATDPRKAYVEGRPGDDSTLRCYCQVYRSMKVYDAAKNSLDPWMETVKASLNHKGIIPLGCRLICSYRDRVVLASSRENPHMWYMSRQGDPYDWDFTAPASDVQRAVYGMNIASGTRKERITALIPHIDDFLIFGYENELWVMRGDPADEGVLYNISREVGVIGPRAWCRTPEGEVVFLSRGGIYIIPVGGERMGGISVRPLSRDIIPQELINLSAEDYDINLAYDVRDNGIIITVCPKGPRTVPLQWWLDWSTKSFWPWMPAAERWSMIPAIMQEYRDPSHRVAPVLMGGRDGVLRAFDPTATYDDGFDGSPVPYESYIEFAPLHVGFEGVEDALVIQMDAVLGAIKGDEAGTGRVRWDLYGSYSAQDRQADRVVVASGEWVPYLNYRSFPRVRGVASLRISNLDRWWAFEGVTIRMRPSGMVRMPRRRG